MNSRLINTALSLTLVAVSMIGMPSAYAVDSDDAAKTKTPATETKQENPTCGAAKFIAPQFRDKNSTSTDAKPAEEKPLSDEEKQKIEEDKLKEAEEKEKAMLQYEGTDHWKKAKKYSSDWKWKLADVELRAAIDCVPDMKVAHRDYCIVAFMQGHLGRTLAELLIVVGAADPVALSDEQKEKLKEDASTIHYNEGVEFATKLKWKEAIDELLQARNYDPVDPVITRSLAFSYSSMNDFAMAEKYYKEAFDLDPNDPFARADYAFLLAKGGKEDEALMSMEEAVKLKPDVIALHVDLGWMAESKGNLNQAEDEFRKACDLEPKQPALWVHLGNICKKLGKVEEAKDAYKKALDLDPKYTEAKEQLSQCFVKPNKTGV